MNRVIKWFGGLALGIVVCISLLCLHFVHSFHVTEQNDRRETESVLQQFHERFNDAHLDNICEAVYDCTISASVQESWTSYLRRVRESTGSFGVVKSSQISVYIEPPSVRAELISSFAKTECREQFILKGFDEHPKDGTYSRGPLKIVSYRVAINGVEIPTQ
jgi:hypothetical protein